MDHGWAVTAGALGKGLKRRLSPALWALLEETYAGADIHENWRALFNAMMLFCQVALEVAAHLGFVFPQVMHERVVVFVDRMKTRPTT